MGAETVGRRTPRRELITGVLILLSLTAVVVLAAILVGAAEVPWREIFDEEH